MEQGWWGSDFVKYLIGWILGIPSGILANWLYDKVKGWRRKETNFISTSYSQGKMKFEGQYTTDVPIQALMEQILKPPPHLSSAPGSPAEPPTQQTPEVQTRTE
jgi:hypothetical protein